MSNERATPDFAWPLTAFRAWKIGDGRLLSTVMDTIWEPFQAMHSTVNPRQAAVMQQWSNLSGDRPSIDYANPLPTPENYWGIHGVKELGPLLEYLGSYFGQLAAYDNRYTVDHWCFGRISLWGQVVEHPKGYRAECAYPKELFNTSAEIAQLAQTYGIPCVEAPTEVQSWILARQNALPSLSQWLLPFQSGSPIFNPMTQTYHYQGQVFTQAQIRKWNLWASPGKKDQL